MRNRRTYEKTCNPAMVIVAFALMATGISLITLSSCTPVKGATSFHQNAEPDIILPTSGNPNPPVGSVPKLVKGARYVIRAKVKCDILTFPEGIVGVEEKTGPRDWTGIFTGGTGDYEDRNFAEPYLYSLKATGKGSVQIVIIPQGYKDKSQWVKAGLEVDGGDLIGSNPPVTSPPMAAPMPVTFPVGERVDKVTVIICLNGPQTDAQRVVTQDDAFLRKLEAGGHKLQIVELVNTDPNGFKPYAQRVGYPAVLVFDSAKMNETQIPLTFFKLPTTGAALTESTWKVIK